MTFQKEEVIAFPNGSNRFYNSDALNVIKEYDSEDDLSIMITIGHRKEKIYNNIKSGIVKLTDKYYVEYTRGLCASDVARIYEKTVEDKLIYMLVLDTTQLHHSIYSPHIYEESLFELLNEFISHFEKLTNEDKNTKLIYIKDLLKFSKIPKLSLTYDSGYNPLTRKYMICANINYKEFIPLCEEFASFLQNELGSEHINKSVTYIGNQFDNSDTILFEVPKDDYYEDGEVFLDFIKRLIECSYEEFILGVLQSI